MNDYEMYSNKSALKSGWNFIDEGRAGDGL